MWSIAGELNTYIYIYIFIRPSLTKSIYSQEPRKILWLWKAGLNERNHKLGVNETRHGVGNGVCAQRGSALVIGRWQVNLQCTAQTFCGEWSGGRSAHAVVGIGYSVKEESPCHPI